MSDRAVPIGSFEFASTPAIHFGAGTVRALPELARRHGRRALLVRGVRSFRESPHWDVLVEGLASQGLEWSEVVVDGEPSPTRVDDAVRAHADEGIQVVIAVGGGSALDAGKAIAGLLPHKNSVLDHLEGVGRGLPYQGPALPCIAVPTTAGTGSEATKNAVLSERGAQGFKKSFRHEALVPRHAVVDPDLLASCPPAQIAANGMDAFTQLLESYVSVRASPMTEALALSGMRAWRSAIGEVFRDPAAPTAARGREGLAYASLLSGVCLAQSGLGSVHGLASPLGAFFPIPHGVVCGALVARATEVNIAALRQRDPDGPALRKYARVGTLLGAGAKRAREEGLDALVAELHQRTRDLGIARLGDYGVAASDIERLVRGSRGSSMKTNPIVLTDEEIASVVRTCL